MPQKEIKSTKDGPMNYSRWHRNKLPHWCYMVDIDWSYWGHQRINEFRALSNGAWFELRNVQNSLQILACIETILVRDGWSIKTADRHTPLWDPKKPLLLAIDKQLGVPAFVVWHNSDCAEFLVLRITEEIPHFMLESQYMEFIKNLQGISTKIDLGPYS